MYALSNGRTFKYWNKTINDMNTFYTIGLFISVMSLTISCSCDCEESKESMAIEKKNAVRKKNTVNDKGNEIKYDGIWEGEGQSVKNDNRWGIILQINGAEANIEYPSLGCRGSLKLLDDCEKSIFFKESIKKGNCKDQGFVKIRYVSDSTLSYKWWFSNGDLGGYSLLSKVK